MKVNKKLVPVFFILLLFYCYLELIKQKCNENLIWNPHCPKILECAKYDDPSTPTSNPTISYWTPEAQTEGTATAMTTSFSTSSPAGTSTSTTTT